MVQLFEIPVDIVFSERMKFIFVSLVFLFIVFQVFGAIIPINDDTVYLEEVDSQDSDYFDGLLRKLIASNVERRDIGRSQSNSTSLPEESNSKTDEESLELAETQSFLPVLHHHNHNHTAESLKLKHIEEHHHHHHHHANQNYL